MLSFINNPLELVIMLAAFLVAITVHEAAHAWMADRLGDPTARLMGRKTLNPLAHLDPIGTLMILFAPFGWAKPVQIDPFNLRNPRRDSALISLAGPITNLTTATVIAIVYYVVNPYLFSTFVAALFQFTIILNVNLAIFNLIPIHPLDGFAVVEGILDERNARRWRQLQPYGMVFLLFLVFPILGSSAPLSRIISPVIDFILGILLPNTGIV